MIEHADHGGNVRGIARERGASITDFLDFSANINPLGPPATVRSLLSDYARNDWITRYPEPGLPELAAALAVARGVGPQHIVIHAGSSALFDVILRACAPRRLGLCIPAFAEYARAANANGIDVRTFALDAGSDAAFDAERFCAWVRRHEIDAVILTNPHNPLGFALSAKLLHEIRRLLPATTFIIDEAFADYDETLSIAPDAAHDSQLVVVRSVTKFYAIPDLRVGYAVMSQERARSMSGYLPAWPVSGIAAVATAAAVADESYAMRTRAANLKGRTKLDLGLVALGLRTLPSLANFLTFDEPGAAALHDRLLEGHRIIVRNCTSFGGLAPDRYIRVAVRAEQDNARLLAALAVELRKSQR